MSKKIYKPISLMIILFMISAYVPALYAQTSTTGAIKGRVYDKDTSMGVPGVTVTVTNELKGNQVTAITDKDGNYFFSLLEPGTYTLTIQLEGYVSDPPSLQGFAVRITNPTTVLPPPFALRKTTGAQVSTPPPTKTPPQNAQGDVIEAAGQLVNTDNATRGGTFDKRQLVVLPLPGVRSFDDLAFLVAGGF